MSPDVHQRIGLCGFNEEKLLPLDNVAVLGGEVQFLDTDDFHAFTSYLSFYEPAR